jgi:isochorismate synthase
MSERSGTLGSRLAALMAGGCSFAVFRRPQSHNVTLVAQDARRPLTTMGSVEQLNGRSGFVVAPFCPSAAHPIVLISADRTEHFALTGADSAGGRTGDVYTLQPDDGYRRSFSAFASMLTGGRFHKLVLSRKADVACAAEIDVEGVLAEACHRYRYSYVYMLHTPLTGTWIGSTPEVLLSGSGGRYATMSLAGTQEAPLDGSTAVEWNEKNRREQALVSDYLRSCLVAHGIAPEESTPRTVRAGELVHLRTDFRFGLTDSGALGTLLATIHPTPAVCGLPKAEAYRYILSNEGYDRGYYTGFVGMLSPEGETDLYVNLRCMRVEGSVATLYAGGGLLATSELTDEWLETERKMATMKRIIRSKRT